MLKRLSVDNYRCLVNFEFAPQKMNLLVGDNGSGKTTVFEVLYLLRRVVCDGVAVPTAFQPSLLTRWDLRRVQRFDLEVEGQGGLYKYVLEIGHDEQPGSTASIRKEQLEWNGRPLYRYHDAQVQLFRDDHSAGPVFPFHPKNSFLPSLEPGPNNRRVAWFRNYLTLISHTRLIPPHIHSTGEPGDEALRIDGANFASVYPYIAQQHPDLLPAFYANLATVLDGFHALRVIPRGKNSNELMLTFTNPAGTEPKLYELPLDEISDGQRMLVVLYFLLLLLQTEPNRLLCLDEPDNYVSLREIQPWLRALGDLVAEGPGQVMVISHHPEVIDYLAADHAFKFERSNGGPSRVRPLQVDRSSGLKASEWLARGMDDGEA